MGQRHGQTTVIGPGAPYDASLRLSEDGRRSRLTVSRPTNCERTMRMPATPPDPTTDGDPVEFAQYPPENSTDAPFEADASGFEAYPLVNVPEGVDPTGFERYPLRKHLAPTWRNTGLPVLMGVLSVILGLPLSIRLFITGDWGSGLLFAGVAGLGMLVSAGSVWRRPRRRGSFHAVEPAKLEIVDDSASSVQLASVRPPALPMRIVFVLAALAGLVLSGAALGQVTGLLPQLNAQTSPVQFVIAAVLGLGITAFFGRSAWSSFQQRARQDPTGPRPVGIALGSSGVAIRVAGGNVDIGWNTIADIDGHLIQPSRGRPVPMIRLKVRDASGRRRDHLLPAENLAVPADAMYTALRWYAAHPKSRWELGRPEGARRLNEWCEIASANWR